MLARLDAETRELEANDNYREHQQNIKAAQLELKQLQAANRNKGNVRAGGGFAGPKKRKKKSGRNVKLMRAVVLPVEFNDTTHKFRIPWWVLLSLHSAASALTASAQ